MARIGSLFAIVLMLLSFTGMAYAEKIEVIATVNSNQVGLGEAFHYTISVSSEESVGVEEPRLPDLSGFQLQHSWRGTESRSIFQNGSFQVEQTQRFNYRLVPQELGALTIGPATVVVNSKAYETKPITLKVVKGRQQQAPPPTQPFAGTMDDMEDLFNRLLEQHPGGADGFRSQPANPNEAFFIQVEVDKTKAYVGEQITASWYLYTRGHIRDLDTLKYPALNGFWKEDIELATRLNFTNEVINGVVYKKALLASFAVFPLKEGKAKIDQYQAKCTVLTQTRFGLGRPYVYTKSSKEIDIDVLPIPKESRPADFSGAVGQFTVGTQLDNNSVPVNQPVTLKIRFEGRGNAKLIDLPPLDLPQSLELYDTKKEAKFFKNGTSFKDFEILLIPREQGELTIPPVTVSMFDPKKKAFYTRTTPELKLTVTPEVGGESIPNTPMATTSPEVKKDSLPPIAVAWEETQPMSPWRMGALWGGLFLAATGLLGWRSVSEFGLLKRKKDLFKIHEKRMKRLRQQLQKGNWRGIGTEGINLIALILGELSGEGGGSLEINKLLIKAPPSVRREVGDALTKLMSKFEALSFAPEPMVGSLKEKKSLEQLVNEVDKLLVRAIRLGVGKDEDVTTDARV